MESNQDPAGLLREADRAAAAPFVDYPRTPSWYPAAAGTWAAAYCLAFEIPSDTPWRAFALLGLLLVTGVFIGWYRRYRGTWPRGRAPREIRRVMLLFYLGLVILIAGLVVVMVGSAPWLAAVAAFISVTPAIAWYEHVYAAAAAGVRARLA